MATAKQLDQWSTFLGWILIIMALIMFWLPMFITLKKDLIDMWWWPVGSLVSGIMLIFCKESFFKSLNNFFTRKANNL